MHCNFDAVLFDFDGTIADTGEGIFSSVRYAVAAIGCEPLSKKRLQTFIGPPIYDSFKRELNIDNETCTVAVKKYREFYGKSGIFQLKVYDGIEELLKELKKHNVKIAIASSKPKFFIEKIIAHLDFSTYVDFVSCPNFDEDRKAKCDLINDAIEFFKAEKSRTVMIGDRLFDINGANLAEIPSIGVSYGYGGKEELENAGASHIASCASDLFKIIFD